MYTTWGVEHREHKGLCGGLISCLLFSSLLFQAKVCVLLSWKSCGSHALPMICHNGEWWLPHTHCLCSHPGRCVSAVPACTSSAAWWVLGNHTEGSQIKGDSRGSSITGPVKGKFIQHHRPCWWQTYTSQALSMANLYNITDPVNGKFVQHHRPCWWQTSTPSQALLMANLYSITGPVDGKLVLHHRPCWWQTCTPSQALLMANLYSITGPINGQEIKYRV